MEYRSYVTVPVRRDKVRERIEIGDVDRGAQKGQDKGSTCSTIQSSKWKPRDVIVSGQKFIEHPKTHNSQESVFDVDSNIR